MNITSIAHETSISISTLQYGIKKLLQKKMIIKTLLNEKPLYSAGDINQLNSWMRAQKKKLNRQSKAIEFFVEQYDFNPQLITPKIRVFEGYSGVKESYAIMLNECGKSIDAIFSANESIGAELQSFFDSEYVPTRVKKKIQMRNLAVEGSTSTEYIKRDNQDLRETRTVSKSIFPKINAEINIYKKSVHCMSFDNKSALAIIVNDASMASILSGVFELVWRGTNNKGYGK